VALVVAAWRFAVEASYLVVAGSGRQASSEADLVLVAMVVRWVDDYRSVGE